MLSGIALVFLSNYFRLKIPKIIRESLDFIFEKIEAKPDGAESFADLYGSEILIFSGTRVLLLMSVQFVGRIAIFLND